MGIYVSIKCAYKVRVSHPSYHGTKQKYSKAINIQSSYIQINKYTMYESPGNRKDRHNLQTA